MAPGAVMGAATGTLVSNILKNVGNELGEQMLGPREKVRIGAALGFAINKIQQNFSKVAILRQDNFFDDKPYDRAAYKEIVECALLAAQREYEEEYGSPSSSGSFSSRNINFNFFLSLLFTQGSNKEVISLRVRWYPC